MPMQLNGVALVSTEEQERLLRVAYEKCRVKMASDPYPQTNATPFCNRTWDNLACWPDSEVGVHRQKCPNYINGFIIHEFAERECMPDGHWYFNKDFAIQREWTNFSRCFGDLENLVPPMIAEHVWIIRLISSIGYGVSLVSLVLATIIMIGFKKLHCTRNTVHINLFVSFILRATVSILQEKIFVNGIGLPQDVVLDLNRTISFLPGPHWECKLFMTVFNYALGANYVWIFIEGLYLHMLIFVSVFSERRGVIVYIIIGWLAPCVFVIPWAIVRLYYENTFCWNTHENDGYLWIIKGPIAVSIVINFIFFLNIVRVLFTKLQAANSPEARRFRYKKLARSTLVLIPLFGVHYIVFLWLPESIGETFEIVKLYFEMIFNSFQGFLVALLFCFLNGEVQGEIKKKFQRYNLRRGSASSARIRSSINTYLSRHTRTSMVPNQESYSLPHLTGVGNGRRSNGNLVVKLNDGEAGCRAIVSNHSPPVVKVENVDEAIPMIADLAV